jgi:hypothetical protein
MFLVEADGPWGLSERGADWLYRVDQALARGPVRSRIVRTQEEVEALAEDVRATASRE